MESFGKVLSCKEYEAELKLVRFKKSNQPQLKIKTLQLQIPLRHL